MKQPIVLSTISIAIAMAALVVSIRTCQRADDSYWLSQEEFWSERLPTWDIRWDSIGQGFVRGIGGHSLVPISDEFRIRQAWVYYPSVLDSQFVWAHDLQYPDFFIPLTTLFNALGKDSACKLVERFEDMDALMEPPADYEGVWGWGGSSGVMSVPIIFTVDYVTKGKRLWDSTLYDLYLSRSDIGNESGCWTMFSPMGLSFRERLDGTVAFVDYLNQVWLSSQNH